MPQSNPLFPKSMFQKGRKNRPEGRGRGINGRGSVGVMRGRKHRHQWGMSCHHLSQHPGPPPSGSQDSCGFLKQQDQLPHSPPGCLLFSSHAFKYFSQDKADHGQPHFKDGEIEAGSSHPRGSACPWRRKHRPLKTPPTSYP